VGWAFVREVARMQIKERKKPGEIWTWSVAWAGLSHKGAGTAFAMMKVKLKCRSRSVALRSGFLGINIDGDGIDLEAQEPVTGHGAAVDFCGSKLPESRGFQCEVGKILARTGSFE